MGGPILNLRAASGMSEKPWPELASILVEIDHQSFFAKLIGDGDVRFWKVLVDLINESEKLIFWNECNRFGSLIPI